MGRPRTDIQTRVLAAARVRFLADGVDGASLRTIAKDAKTNIGMIFYYYPTKDALFLAVVEQFYVKLVADIEATLSRTASLRERLRAMFTRIGRASPEELDTVRLIVREGLVSSPRLGQLLARFQRGHISLVAAALGEGARAGEIDGTIPPPLLLIATFAMGGLPQLARRIFGENAPLGTLPSPDALADAAVSVLFEGIGAKASESTAKKRPKKRAARVR